MTKIVGLTGNIASGKSTVARLFGEWGATVIDADQIVHELERPGTEVFRQIVERFGPSVVGRDHQLDRNALRRRVFADPAELRSLNAIVHPAVNLERQRRTAAAHARGARIVVNDVPLLFEVMDPALFDEIVLVDAPLLVRRERLAKIRNLDIEAANAMIASQMPADQKRPLSDYVIDNDAGFDVLRHRARKVWEALDASCQPNAAPSA